MPFGLKNAPTEFQKLMGKLKADIGDNIQIYMDDILIGSDTATDGLSKLKKTFDALRRFNLTLNLKKCSFMQQHVNYLGHQILPEGICPGEYKTNAVSDFKQPTNVKETRQFLGLCGYFRKFVQDFSIIAAPLTKLLKKDDIFCWTKDQEKGFLELKKALINKPLLTIYKMNANHEVHTDASSIGLAGILMQQDDKLLKPVAYYSRTTSASEAKFHSYELETLAIVESLERFKYYLLGKTFKVVNDCASLKTTMTKKELIPRIARWWLRLQDFDFKLEHRSGNRMAHVDALSRRPAE